MGTGTTASGRPPNIGRPDLADVEWRARMEAKLDIALADTRRALEDQGRRLGEVERATSNLDQRTRVVETGTAVCQAAVEEVRRAMDNTASSTRANIGLVLAGVSGLVGLLAFLLTATR